MTDCACYDGPLSSADPSLVSMRCRDHQHIPPLVGHRWIRRDQILGQLKMNEWYENRKRYATPKKRRHTVRVVTTHLTRAERKALKIQRKQDRERQRLEMEAAAAAEATETEKAA